MRSMSSKMSALKNHSAESYTWNRMADLGSPSTVEAAVASHWVKVECQAVNDWSSTLLHRACVWNYSFKFVTIVVIGMCMQTRKLSFRACQHNFELASVRHARSNGELVSNQVQLPFWTGVQWLKLLAPYHWAADLDKHRSTIYLPPSASLLEPSLGCTNGHCRVLTSNVQLPLLRKKCMPGSHPVIIIQICGQTAIFPVKIARCSPSIQDTSL